MQNIKLHEATKQFQISNKLAIFFLKKKNIPVKSHSSSISMEQLEILREFASNKEKFSEIYTEFDNEEKAKKNKSIKVMSNGEKDHEEIPVEPEINQVEVTQHEVEKEEIEIEEKVEINPPPSPVIETKEKPKTIKKPEVIRLKPEKKEIDLEPKPMKKPEEMVTKVPGAPKVKEVKPPERRADVKVEKFVPPQVVPKLVSRKVFKEKKEVKKKPVKPPLPKIKRKRKTFNLPELIQISDYINIKELAEKLNLKLKDIEERMRFMGKENYITNQMLEIGEIKEICKEFEVEVDIVSFEDAIFFGDIEKNKANLAPRAPVVTVMGHVDHGKTTLLDTLRNTRVAEKEAGKITQKIGAYKLDTNENEIIFLDTPGHEAFTNIRARGAQVTDIVILMVAANDGVKPQTIEAINHAQAADVPLVVAINKIDLDGADANKVKEELAKHNILVEDWGGDVVSVDVSAKQNKNLDSLLEMVGLVSEMLELKAYKDIPARGTVIESRLDSQLGALGTVLIQHGKVKRGDFFICGNSVGKVKSIFNDRGKALQYAHVPQPVEIMGFENIPDAGELFQVTNDIEKAKKVIDMRKLKIKHAKKDEIIADKKLSLENLFERFEENSIKNIPMIIKTDNFSSGEVLESILFKQNQDKIKINIIHKGIGNITESDILLASTSYSIIIGFNVKAPQKILGLAKRENIEIKLYNVIYHLIEDIEKAIRGEVEPEYIESKIGQLEVLQTFKISKIGIIAGSLVREGKITNKSKLKVFRKDDLVFEGEIETLRRIKKDVTEVNAGTECGIKIKNFNAIEVGDIVDVYELIKKE